MRTEKRKDEHPLPWTFQSIVTEDYSYCNLFDADENYICTVNDYEVALFIVNKINDNN